MIKSLQSLRGISAILIVAHHFGFQSGVVESFGDFAVAVFMMLSGFVLALGYHARVSDGYDIPFRRFMLKRMIRVAPLYLLGQLYIIIFCRFHVSAAKMIPDMLMLQSWIPSPDFYFSGNAPSWFVSDLMLCYLLFIPAITLINRRPRLFACIFSLYMIAYFSCVILLPGPLVHPIVYIFPPMQFPVFVLGMLLAKRYGAPREGFTATTANVVVIVIIMMVAAQMWYYESVTPRLTLSSYWWIATGLLIVGLTLLDANGCMMIRIFHLTPLIRLGDISYAVYIFHIPFLYTWQVICRHLDLTIPILPDFVIFTSLTIVGGVIIHYLIEIPVTKKLDTFVNYRS